MKSKNYTILVLLSTAYLFACNSNNKTIELHDSTQVATTTNTTVVLDLAFKNDTLKNIYASYTNLKDALVATKADEAKTAASSLAIALKGFEGCESAANIAGKISTATEIKAQRAAFTDLNVELIPVFKHAALTAGTIYVQHCPMANNGDGADWLSSVKKIQNPYYGDEMLECGRIAEEIRAK
jgi:Cu(I)/Ag(I) efflux system membrane fusion protein